jgi:ABC-type nitrate/sulfonate/bicarbonate transport system substrate-binding protein
MILALALFGLHAVALKPVLALDEARLHISGGGSPNELIFRSGQQEGFYKQEGIELLPIVAGMLPGIQALIAGAMDFSQIGGQGAAAILRGAPLRIVMIFDTRPANWLVGCKNIRTLQDLKGKKQVGVSSFGAALDQMTREILPRHGIDPQRDVALRSITRSSDRLPALLSGSVDAAVLSATDTLTAKKQGCRELIFYGNELEFISGGVVVNTKTLAERFEYVRRFLRATVKSFRWFKTNEKGAVALMRKYGNFSEGDADTIHRMVVPLYSRDGTIPPSFQERMIALQKANLKVDKKVTPEMVYDFSIVESLNRELEKESRCRLQARFLEIGVTHPRSLGV